MRKRKKYKFKKEALKSKEDAIKKANRYFDNAKETLRKSAIEYNAYQDSKYVSEASAMGYLAVLRAIDGYLLGIGAGDLPDSHEQYTYIISKKIPKNGKLKNYYNIVYQNLHLLGYYRGGIGVEMIKEGFSSAKKIIQMLSK